MNLPALFPDEDYRFTMRFDRGSPEAFFAPSTGGAAILAERRKWLVEDEPAYASVLPEGGPLLAEFLEFLRAWPATRDSVSGIADDSATSCAEIGRRIEPDFLLLRADANGAFRLHAACVCFPSSWNLAEKMGRPLDEIHAPVPGLNPALARPISGFLAKLPPGISWLRANWGLSRSPELNQHPHRRLPRLDDTVRADEIFLRVEHQSLVALPRTAGVLFGIRIEVMPLDELRRDPGATAGLVRALRTMPEPVAAYKGIAPARVHILSMLEGAS